MDVNKVKFEALAQQYAGQTILPIKLMEELLDQLILNLTKELVDQGHKLTGNLISSLKKEVETTGTEIIGRIFADDYAIYVNEGVKPEKIPYTEGSGATHSKYIEGLIKYWRARGLEEKESKTAAFFTARKHKEEGMPTKHSYTFSKNGRRTGFIDSQLYTEGTPVRQVIASVFEGAVAIMVRKLIRSEN